MAKRHQRALRVDRLLSHTDSPLALIAAKARQHQAIETKLRRALGSPLAEHVSLGELTPRRLVIVTDSPVWSNRIRYQSKTLLASLSEYFDSRITPKLEVKIVPASGQEPRRKRKAAQLSTQAAEHLAQVARNTPGDDKLKAVLTRLASRAKR